MLNGLVAWLLLLIGEFDSKKYLNLTKCINAPLHWAIIGRSIFQTVCQTLQLSAWTFVCATGVFSPITRSIRTTLWRLIYFYFHFWLLTWRETWSISTFGCPRPSQLCTTVKRAQLRLFGTDSWCCTRCIWYNVNSSSRCNINFRTYKPHPSTKAVAAGINLDARLSASIMVIQNEEQVP